MFQWVKPIQLDDEVGNPNPWIVTHAQEFGVDVERVLSKEVHNESFTKDIEDSFQRALYSHQKVDSMSVGQSSRPSTASTFASSYDGSRGRTDDGGDNARGDIDWGMLTKSISNESIHLWKWFHVLHTRWRSWL